MIRRWWLRHFVYGASLYDFAVLTVRAAESECLCIGVAGRRIPNTGCPRHGKADAEQTRSSVETGGVTRSPMLTDEDHEALEVALARRARRRTRSRLRRLVHRAAWWLVVTVGDRGRK